MSRWGKKAGRSSTPVIDTSGEQDESYDDASTRGNTGAYVPPPTMSSEDHNEGVEHYISSPLRQQPKSLLTGNISSLFRRSSSKERKTAAAEAAAASPTRLSSPTSSGSGRRSSSRGRSRNKSEQLGDPAATHPLKPHRSPKSPSSSSKKHLSNSPRRIKATAADAAALPRSTSNRSSNHRLFYSSHGDDDSEDSYESRANQSQSVAYTRDTRSMGDNETSYTTRGDGTSEDDAATTTIGTILRYRGFSTSIQNLFLDEALVCAAMGCFGLILSNRTEYLLQLRNDRRGVRWGRSTSRRTLPSRIVAYALLLTFILVASTFVIWGFGSGESSGFAKGFYDGYETNNYNGNQQNNYYANDDDGNGDDNQAQEDDQGDDAAAANDDGNGRLLLFSNNLKKSKAVFLAQCPHPTHGIFKIRDVHEGLWEPAIDFFKEEWYRDMDPKDTPKVRGLSQSSKGGSYYSSSSSSKQQQGDSSRNLAADLRLSFIIAFLIVLGVLGRRRRMRTRYYLVRARAQEDHLFYASAAAGVKRVAFQDSREDQYEGACSHTLCGCYPIDPPMEGDEIDDDVKVDDDGVVQRKKVPYQHDCVSRGFSCLMGCCCGLLCRCWFQCMSICALAQEAREIRLLVPTRYQRVDFITHQPFHEYQKNVNDLRRGWLGKSRKKAGFMPHFQALSRLSRYTLAWFLICFIIISATLLFNPNASFSWPDMVILVATFAQSFIVLYLIHWIFHKSDLSLDAVIKFFAAGFMIAVPAAFFFEGMLVNIMLTLAYMGFAVGELISDNFTVWVVDNYKWCWIIGELVNAYIVAAITEELCKYYTFRCVEHPDLIFLTGLARVSQDERAVQGGIVKYPFSSHQVENTNKRGGTGYDDDDDRSVSSRASHRSTRGRTKSPVRTELNPSSSEEEFEEDDNDVRTYRQKAAAVTTGMISVAVGLACAENFLYVFLLGGAEANSGEDHSGGVIEEWIVLLFRSLFPVHALAAAMQSISVIRKYVECDTDEKNRIGVGRIILPAVIMHGSFDATLLAINIYIESAWDTYLEKNGGNFDPNEPPYNPVIVNVVAWVSIVLIMMGGLSWYYRQNRQQRQRLIVLEEKEKSALGSNYQNPDANKSGKRISEVELV